MKRALLTFLLLTAFAAGSRAMPAAADPAIHEIVAAYCSGGGVGVITSEGFLEPPGVTGSSNADNFARPVIASGAVQGSFPNITITDKPNAKYAEGTNVITGLSGSTVTHASAARCPGASVLP